LFCREEGASILKPFIPWVGGKTALRPILYRLFPNGYTRLVEVFGGAAAVTFGREPDRCEEVYNDYNSNLVNLFWCVRNRPLALIQEIGFLPLNSRQEFEVLRKFLREEEFTDDYLKEEMELCKRYFEPPEREELLKLLTEKTELGDVRKAAAFYKVIRYSYAGGGTSYGGKPIDIRRGLHLIWACSRRLQNVVIENLSYEAIVPKYDAPGTLLYFDPPYYQAECYEVAFGMRDHYRLRELFGECGCYAVLSYNDHPFIRELYKGFWIFSVTRQNTMANRYASKHPEKKNEYGELIILNYDPRDHPKDRQMTLFDQTDKEQPEYEYTLICEGGKGDEKNEVWRELFADPGRNSGGGGAEPGARCPDRDGAGGDPDYLPEPGSNKA